MTTGECKGMHFFTLEFPLEKSERYGGRGGGTDGEGTESDRREREREREGKEGGREMKVLLLFFIQMHPFSSRVVFIVLFVNTRISRELRVVFT